MDSRNHQIELKVNLNRKPTPFKGFDFPTFPHQVRDSFSVWSGLGAVIMIPGETPCIFPVEA
jgi:hypothetical protein